MLKILQARLQQYVNNELPDVQHGFRKGRGTRDQITNIHWFMEKAREFQKTSISASLTTLWASLVAQEDAKASACRGRPGFDPWVGKIPWRQKWQPTPVPGKFHGWRNLVGYSPWGHKESDTTERIHFTKSLTVWITNWKIFWNWNTRPHYLPPEKPVCRSRSNS